MLTLALIACVTLQTPKLSSGSEAARRFPGFGVSVCRLPDIDGDGVEDFAVGSAHAFTKPTGDVFFVSGATGKSIRRIEGDACTMFGESFALVPSTETVAARLAVSRHKSTQGGRLAQLVLHDLGTGTQTSPALDLVPVDAGGGRRVWMMAVNRSPEAALSAEGDPDVIVCVRSDGDTITMLGVAASQRVILFMRRVESVPAAIDEQTLHSIGDLDADGVDDVLVAGSRSLLAYSARSGAPLMSAKLLEDEDPRLVTSACAGPDVDRDRVTEIVVGVPGEDAIIGRGRVLLCSGRDGRVLMETKDIGEARLGVSLLDVPDLDEDGLRDVVVGTHGLAGNTLELLSGASLARIRAGPGSDGQLPDRGLYLVRGADYDGDGMSDVIVARYSLHACGLDEQGVVLHSGAGLGVIRAIEISAWREPPR